MRIIVFFDLPTDTPNERRAYTAFRKSLIKSGFVMMQESVYTKIALNSTAAELIKTAVRDISPDKGIVQMLVITEKQFANIEYVTGTSNSEVIDSPDRLVIL